MTQTPISRRNVPFAGILSQEFDERLAQIGIDDAQDKTEMKQRIMRAYEAGQLTAFETRVLVVWKGLEAA